MRILGLDVGDKRIGIAISDELGHTAQGLTSLDRASKEADIRKMKEIIEDYSVEKVVVGIPLRMDGTEGIQAQKVRDFASKLQATIHQPIVFWDERLTTVTARRALISGEVRRAARKRIIDKVAAALILQSYLDSQK